jgi:hypothetical protein
VNAAGKKSGQAEGPTGDRRRLHIIGYSVAVAFVLLFVLVAQLVRS